MSAEQLNAPTWRTRDGREMTVADMDTSHIERAVAMLRRKGWIAPSTLRAYLYLDPHQMADGAYDAAMSEFAELIKRPVSEFLDVFEQVLAERKATTEFIWM